LLGLLDDDSLRQIARLKLEGYTNEEIAERLGIVERTVERRLNRIRRQWMEALGP
jgi:DNA-directed RNA polymerase specialized sigma24 family protein